MSQQPPDDPQRRELLAERERLVQRFALMQSDLGGVFYEMAIRDHVRMDVLTTKAAELQRVDAALAAVERSLRGEEGAPAGTCPACSAPHGAESRFCSRCGQPLALAVNGSAAATNGSGTPANIAAHPASDNPDADGTQGP